MTMYWDQTASTGKLRVSLDWGGIKIHTMYLMALKPGGFFTISIQCTYTKADVKESILSNTVVGLNF